MGKIKNFFKTLKSFWGSIKSFWGSILEYISNPIKEKREGEIAISNEDVRTIEQELSTEYNLENNFDSPEFTNESVTWIQNNFTNTSMRSNGNIDEKYLQSENGIPNCRGISKSYNLSTGEILYILGGIAFPEKSMTFTSERKQVDGKDITILNSHLNGKLSIGSDGNIFLDGQPLEMNPNIKNRLSEQIKKLDGQDAKLSFDNGEFSILPRVQTKDLKVDTAENKPHNIKSEMAMPPEEQDRLANLAKESAKRIKEENENPSLENTNAKECLII